MIPAISFSVIFNHPANVCAALLALASEDEILPLHFRRLQDNRNRPDALSAVDVVENLLLCPLRNSRPSSCCLQRERIAWMLCHYHFVFSMQTAAQRQWSTVR